MTVDLITRHEAMVDELEAQRAVLGSRAVRLAGDHAAIAAALRLANAEIATLRKTVADLQAAAPTVQPAPPATA